MMASPEYKSNDKLYKCQGCGMLFTEGQGLCMNCGNSLSAREPGYHNAIWWWEERKPVNFQPAIYMCIITFVMAMLYLLLASIGIV